MSSLDTKIYKLGGAFNVTLSEMEEILDLYSMDEIHTFIKGSEFEKELYKMLIPYFVNRSLYKEL